MELQGPGWSHPIRTGCPKTGDMARKSGGARGVRLGGIMSSNHFSDQLAKRKSSSLLLGEDGHCSL